MKFSIFQQSTMTAIFFVIVCIFAASPIQAQQMTGLDIYTRSDPPAMWTGSPAPHMNGVVPDPGWTSRGTGSSPDIMVPGNGTMYFAFENVHVPQNTKTMTVFFQALNGSLPDFEVVSVTAYQTDNTNGTPIPDYECQRFATPGLLKVKAIMHPQPEWEVVEIKNTSDEQKMIRVDSSDSNCAQTSRSTGENGVPDSRIEFEYNMFGAEGPVPDTTRFTQVEIFPRNVDLDPGIAPVFEAPPETGNWTPELVFVDPNGDPRPGGGVRWTTDGFGLTDGQMHSLAITMMDAADSSYLLFAFDEDVFQYQEHFIDLRDLPWYEDFETHFPGVGADNWRGWKGWDDDPAFDAPVTEQQPHGGANSIQIENDADLVKEFEADSGLWSFEAWQYIPSDFESGGTGANRGSWFLLLNTYNDGGPYNWSVGLQVDSVPGLIKVYQGDELNTVNIPYETDRWVKIQSVINLDDDWTRIYYDDEFVKEYSWTGGILGDGGGSLDIAAVDLFANGSTKIYYDDLSLTPHSILRGDVNLDQSVNLLDVGPFIDRISTGTYQPEADTNEDGDVNLLDVESFINVLGG